MGMGMVVFNVEAMGEATTRGMVAVPSTPHSGEAATATIEETILVVLSTTTTGITVKEVGCSRKRRSLLLLNAPSPGEQGLVPSNRFIKS